MATIKFGGAITDARGSIAGTVFSRNKGGSYMRQRVKPTNPNTPAQAGTRGLFGTLQAAWRDLTEAERDSWAAAAPNYPVVNRLGDAIEYTPLQLFTRCNMVVLSAGGTQLNTINPNPGADVPIAASQKKAKPHPWDVLSSALDSADIYFDIPGGSLPMQSRFIVKASAPVSPGIRSVRSVRLKTIGYYESTDIVITGTEGVLDVLADYESVFGSPSVEPGEQVVFISVEGYAMNRGFTRPVGTQRYELEAGI